MATGFLILVLFAFTSSFAFASDHSPLQDFCVANPRHPGLGPLPNVVGLIPNSPVLVNGLACMDPKLAQADDFYFMGLHNPGNTSNKLGSSLTLVSVAQVPGLNTFGISMARIDYAPWGLNPPHIHPRASEILTVLEGTLYVGFVTSNPENRLITKVLQKGDVFVFPVGLIHFERNVGYGNAVAIVALSSQNPGVIAIASTVFGSNPQISDEVLAHAFQVDKNVVDYLQSQF